MDISKALVAKLRNIVYQDCRLLERRIFAYFFEGGSREVCIRALTAYQNEDGGFGNGIEPDLSTPSSTAIGAETALYVLDMLDWRELMTLEGIRDWARNSLNKGGFIEPPGDLTEYPHQPWWNTPDEHRVLSIAGLLKRFSVSDPELEQGVERFAMTREIPAEVEFYDYPLFIYALYNKTFPRRDAVISHYLSCMPALLENHRDHYPLFTRYWHHAIPLLDPTLVREQADLFMAAFEEDGTVKNPYPQLPWWKTMFTLDGLMVLQRNQRYLG